jgi:cyanophycinase
MRSIITLLTLAMAMLSVAASNCTSPYVGPASGSLLIIGGGTLDDSLYQKFINLSGGPDVPLVVIPTADGAPSYDQNFSIAVTLRQLGATNVTVLHTYDPQVADTEAFTAPLNDAGGVFFGGGRQWRLVDAYAGTLTEKKFFDVLGRGGAIGGSSAGATIQGSFLTRGDTENNEIIVGDHQVGFGFVKNIAIDQHVLVRNRMFDMFEVLKVQPELLGVGINENTALVVQKNSVEVIGASYALIYDGKWWSRDGGSPGPANPSQLTTFYMLQAGDKYDLGLRQVVE